MEQTLGQMKVRGPRKARPEIGVRTPPDPKAIILDRLGPCVASRWVPGGPYTLSRCTDPRFLKTLDLPPSRSACLSILLSILKCLVCFEPSTKVCFKNRPPWGQLGKPIIGIKSHVEYLVVSTCGLGVKKLSSSNQNCTSLNILKKNIFSILWPVQL